MKPTILCRVAIAGGAVLLSHAAPVAQKSTASDPGDRAALLALIAAVDAAQAQDARGDDFAWENHALKSIDRTAYVPFRVFPPDSLRPKNALMYVRAVSRHDGMRSKDERSFLRDWLQRNVSAPPSRQETIVIGPGEMPVGGPASSSSRPQTQAAAEASARLRLQERALERARAEEAASKARAEGREQRDPFRFPFEDYYPIGGAPPFERALALPAGEYDVFIALAGRSGGSTTPIVARHTLTIPDFWNDQLSLSSVILAGDVRALGSPLSPKDQAAHPYTFGHAQVIVHAPAFTRDDVLSIVYQICNYGAPGSELTADYAFYRVDGGRQLFNRTQPQQLTDDDLPRQANVWETQAFVTQAVPLKTFPPGAYELEITVRDRLTRGIATSSAAFTIRP